MRATQAHLTPRLLAHLRSRSSGPEVVVRRVVPHLQRLWREAGEGMHRLRKEARYLDDVVAFTEGKGAPRLWRRFKPLSFANWLRAVELGEATHTWGFCRLLQRRTHEAQAARPRSHEAVELLALRVAERLDESYGPEWIADLQAEAWALPSTARRLNEDPNGAASAFEAARPSLLSGTGDPGVEGSVQERCEAGPTPDALRRLAQDLERDRRPSVQWWSAWGTTPGGARR